MLTTEELHILEHSTGWKSKTPLFRNRFVTGPACDNFETVCRLCRAGLMRIVFEPSELSHGDRSGIEALGPKPAKKQPKGGG